MLDINFVRANLELVRKKLDERGFPAEAIARFGELDERRRRLISIRDELNATRNRESQEIGQLMKSGQGDQAESRRLAVREIGDRIAAIGNELGSVEEDLSGLMTSLPNLQHDSVPVGADESANQEIKRWGAPPEFSFEPLDHVDPAELGEAKIEHDGCGLVLAREADAGESRRRLDDVRVGAP